MSVQKVAKAGVPATLAAAIGMLGAMALIGLAPSAQADEACPDVDVVFARGTNEPAGLGPEGEAFVDALRTTLPGKTVTSYAVNYPASFNFLKATDGANDASAHIQSTAASCPNTSFVLGGYSQGAAVVDILTAAPGPVLDFADPLPPGLADRVAAVAVFGNPADRIGLPLTGASPLYGVKTAEYCTVGDPICSDGNDRAAHSLYIQSGLVNQAAEFATARVSGASVPPATQLTSNVSSGG
ncbi:cutinase family protein [Mycolicibacterium celeriflavum]|uniref:cutinase family protein n=1 Tax=Mycolicibacterium celeriflavum TaxID=1249101 RepID=UPI003CF0D367